MLLVTVSLEESMLGSFEEASSSRRLHWSWFRNEVENGLYVCRILDDSVLNVDGLRVRAHGERSSSRGRDMFDLVFYVDIMKRKKQRGWVSFLDFKGV
jgi:hypothetical protein